MNYQRVLYQMELRRKWNKAVHLVKSRMEYFKMINCFQVLQQLLHLQQVTVSVAHNNGRMIKEKQ